MLVLPRGTGGQVQAGQQTGEARKAYIMRHHSSRGTPLLPHLKGAGAR